MSRTLVGGLRELRIRRKKYCYQVPEVHTNRSFVVGLAGNNESHWQVDKELKNKFLVIAGRALFPLRSVGLNRGLSCPQRTFGNLGRQFSQLVEECY